MKKFLQIAAFLFLYVLFLAVSQDATAQNNKKITGIVVASDNNEPLPSVAIHIKEHPTFFTMSDNNGNYTLNIPDGDGTVIFEMLGYDTKEIKLSASPVLFTVVTMIIQANALDEVVVVGFGSQKKESLVGAVQAVKPENLIVTSSNLTTSFAGNIPGVIATQRSGEPGYDAASFYIRGRSTFGYNTGALIVLDGVEITAMMLNNIPPEAIESLSVLKDATATALYGSRGANGVIIVTTKEGRNSEKLTINASVDNTISMPTMVQDIADGVTYMRLYNESRYNDARATGSEYVQYYSDEKIDGTRRALNPYVFPNNDWYHMLFKNFSMNQRVNLSLRGGGQRVNYFLNASIFNENGILNKPSETPLDIHMNNKKYLFQSNVTAMMTRTTKISMKLNMQIQYNYSPYESTNNLFYYVMRANPTKFPAVLPAQEGDKYVRYGNNDTWDTGNTDLNPYALLSRGYKNRFYSYTTALVNGDQNLDMITKGLSARVIASFYNYAYASTNRYMTPYYFKVVKPAASPDGTWTYEMDQAGDPGNTYLTSSVSHNGYHEWSLQGSLNYAATFGKHDVATDLVYHMKEKVNNAVGASEEQLLPFREQGLAGRVTYNYAQRYFIEANFGYNGSENFMAGKRFGFFPSIAAGWTISNEPFFAPLHGTINHLKFRASYGLVGNDALAQRFPFLTEVNMGSRSFTFGFPLVNQGAGYINTYGNENATWEVSKKWNFGADLTLWKEFKFSVDYFLEHRSDIFMRRQSLSAIAGMSKTNLPYANIGKVDNSGVDMSLEYNHVVSSNFTFSARGTFTYAHNKVVFRDEPSYPEENKHLSQIGHSMDSPRVLIAEGLFTSQEEIDRSPKQNFGSYYVGDIKYKDVNGDGNVDSNDLIYYDTPTLPLAQFGLGGSVRFYNWDAALMFQGSAGYMIYMYNHHPFCDTEHFGYGIAKYIADDHWSWDNNNAKASYPRLTATPSNNNTQPSTWFLKDGTYVRLKSAEIGYRFLKNFRVYASGSNLFYISPFKFWDPEKGNGNGLSYPLQRTVRLGIQFNF